MKTSEVNSEIEAIVVGTQVLQTAVVLGMSEAIEYLRGLGWDAAATVALLVTVGVVMTAIPVVVALFAAKRIRHDRN